METALKSQQIDQMEPAIFVLGAISDPDGAFNLILIHLPNLVPYLMKVLANTNEVIRASTLWTLSKFTEWIA
jgi:transportin-1